MPLNNFTFSKTKRLALTAILLAAFALRVVGIDYGLPQEFIGDEFVQVAVALKMLDEKSLLPYFPDFFTTSPFPLTFLRRASALSGVAIGLRTL